ncbi:MAG: 4a-hydroxytetrahydrobiopterin dehydratase [Polyangiaceae bacterium]|jgi:4a-hydroxytetrahydrobiopterin dehydratase
MHRPVKLDASAIEAFLSAHEGWARGGSGSVPPPADSIVRSYTFADFSAALGFVVRVGLAAEKMDHHPDIELGWGKARVRWSTHDAGGVTSLDLQLAEMTDALARG